MLGIQSSDIIKVPQCSSGDIRLLYYQGQAFKHARQETTEPSRSSGISVSQLSRDIVRHNTYPAFTSKGNGESANEDYSPAQTNGKGEEQPKLLYITFRELSKGTIRTPALPKKEVEPAKEDFAIDELDRKNLEKDILITKRASLETTRVKSDEGPKIKRFTWVGVNLLAIWRPIRFGTWGVSG